MLDAEGKVVWFRSPKRAILTMWTVLTTANLPDVLLSYIDTSPGVRPGWCRCPREYGAC